MGTAPCVSSGLILPPGIHVVRSGLGNAEHSSIVSPCRGGPGPASLCLSCKASLIFGAWIKLWRVLAWISLLLPLVTLAAHPDGNCSPSWKSCLLCAGLLLPKQLEVFGQGSQPFLQGNHSCPVARGSHPWHRPLSLGCSALTSLKIFYIYI